LAETIIDSRHAAGLSQAALARRAGISPSYMSRIESATWTAGGPWPGDGVLRSLARALGLSSTLLMTLLRTERGVVSAARRRTRMPYAVSVGSPEVHAAAVGVIERNPRHGTVRLAHVPPSTGDGCPGSEQRAPSYIDALEASMEADPDAILYRVCVATRSQPVPMRASVTRIAGRGGPPGVTNVRTRIALTNPVTLEIIIGDHELLLAIPDRRGHPHLRAGIVVNDPDFVAAAARWFDESVWDPPR